MILQFCHYLLVVRINLLPIEFSYRFILRGRLTPQRFFLPTENLEFTAITDNLFLQKRLFSLLMSALSLPMPPYNHVTVNFLRLTERSATTTF